MQPHRQRIHEDAVAAIFLQQHLREREQLVSRESLVLILPQQVTIHPWPDLWEFHNKRGLGRNALRHTGTAIGVLGDKHAVRRLVRMFSKPFRKNDLLAVGSCVAGLTWIRDQGQVDPIVALTKHKDSGVRGMAMIALGHLGAQYTVDPLTRCFQNMSHDNRFKWRILYEISLIL